MKNRSEQIDFIKSIAILGVIAIHVWQYFLNSPLNFFIWNYLHFVVAAFVFCSGYLISQKYGDVKMTLKSFLIWVKKRAVRLLVPYYLYLFFHYSLWKLFPLNFSGIGIPKTGEDIIKSIFLNGGADSGWLVLLFIQMAVIFELYTITRQVKFIKYFYLITVILLTLFFPLFPQIKEYSRQVMFIPWSLILIASMWAAKYDFKHGNNKSIYLYSGIISFIVFLSVFSWLRFQGADSIRLIDHKYPPDILNLSYGLSMTLFLFYLGKKFLPVNKKTSEIILYLSQNSYTLFFVHFLVLDFMLKTTGSLNIVVNAPVIFAMVLTLSLFITSVINWLKKILLTVILH